MKTEYNVLTPFHLNDEDGEKRRVELKKELERLRSLEWGLQDRDKSHHRMFFDGANNPTPT